MASERRILLLVAGLAVCSADGAPQGESDHCAFTQATQDSPAAGLIIGADVLLPTEAGRDFGVLVRFNGTIGAVGPFDAVRNDYPDAAVLDCRGEAGLSPGLVNPHEHPAYSYAYPDPNLRPYWTSSDGRASGFRSLRRGPSP